MSDSDEESEKPKKRDKFRRERFSDRPRYSDHGECSRDEYEDERERMRSSSSHGRQECGSPPAKRDCRRQGWESLRGYGMGMVPPFVMMERREAWMMHGLPPGGPMPPGARFFLRSEVMMGYGSPMEDPHHCQVTLLTLAENMSSLAEKVSSLASQQQQMMEKLSDNSKKLDSLTKDTQVLQSLKSLLRNNLKCRICHISPMIPPIIFAKCCKVILGCEDCVSAWFQGPDALTKTCPHCQAPQAFTETLRIHGLDELLTELLPLIGDEN